MAAQQFDRLASGLYLEGLAVDHERGIVWYSDVIAGGLHGLHADGRSAGVLAPERMWTGGLLVNADGAVLSSGEHGIMWSNPDTGKSGWLLREVDGQPINGVNEMMPDGTGGIYFGTIDLERILRGQPTRPAGLYRLTAEGKAYQLAADVGLVNGIMLSPDRRTLYYNVTFDATYAVDVQADMSLGPPRKLLDKPDADGMALDADGNLWITGYRSGEITRLKPDGTPLTPVPTPAGAITQVRFSGVDARDFYLTTVPADAGDKLAVGTLPTAPESFLYRGRSETPGMPVPPARFTLQ